MKSQHCMPPLQLIICYVAIPSISQLNLHFLSRFILDLLQRRQFYFQSIDVILHNMLDKLMLMELLGRSSMILDVTVVAF